MALDAQVEAAESVVGQAVGAALQDDGGGSVEVDDVLHDGLEHELIGQVVHALEIVLGFSLNLMMRQWSSAFFKFR